MVLDNRKEILATLDGFLNHCKESHVVPDDIMTEININTNFLLVCQINFLKFTVFSLELART